MSSRKYIVLLGTPINGVPRPWKYFDVPGVMVNAYEFIQNPSLLRKVENSRGLRRYLELNEEHILVMDSGGYQNLVKGLNIDLETVLKIYKKFVNDVAYFIVLDYPLSPWDSQQLQREKLMKTLSNYQVLRDHLGEKVAPVLHLAEIPLDNILSEFDGVEYLAIGGLVPYILTKKGVKQGRKRAYNFVSRIKSNFTSLTKIHLLGLGSPCTINLMLGAFDITDSSTWRIKAAYGKVLLPSGGERHITSREVRFGVSRITAEERYFLEELFANVLGCSFSQVAQSFELRALFNAWVITHFEEANLLWRKYDKSCSLEPFMRFPS